VAGERRVVTVVFADLAGFTTMAEGRDPEAVKELLDTCFGALVPVITAHGGVVDKIIGDELMAVFGAPRAHEDDPERAVRAGLALLDALERLDQSLEMRVGINTGEVLAGGVGPSGAYTVTGDTVNTAHRLVGVARRSTVLVAERTFAATRAAIVYGGPAALHLRGRQEPVVAHRALRVRHRPGVRADRRLTTPMVGRDSELARLVGLVEASIATSRPHLATILGEAGLGKSRLVDELGPALHWRGIGARVLIVPCAPYGDQGPLAPLSGLVRAALEVDDQRSPEAQRRDVAVAVHELPLGDGPRQPVIDRVQQLLGIADLAPARRADAVPTRHRLTDDLAAAARLVLEAVASAGPLVAVFDDAHFADRLVLDQLERVPTWDLRNPVTVVVVGRDELALARPRLQTAQGPRHLVEHLAPLAEAASDAVLHHTLAEIDGQQGTLTPAVTAQILEAAGGNPLLLDQLARFLRETGALVAVEGGWRAVRDLAEVGLPDDARALLGARLDGLPADDRALLQDAAIVGRTFDPAAVRALGGAELDHSTLERLVELGLLHPGTVDGEVAFQHAMVRDAAYASVPLGERHAKHAALARWMVEHADEGEGTDPETARIAHHFERAISLQRELGGAAPDPALVEQAARYLLAAARLARQRDELREAERWYERLRNLDLLQDADRLPVALEQAATLVTLHRAEDAAAAYQLVADEAPPGSALAGEACTGLGLTTRLLGDAERAAAWFDQGRLAWQATGDLAGEARSVRAHGWSELMAGRPRAALPKLLRARELEDLAGSGAGETLQCLAWCEFLIGDHAAARTHLWAAAQALAAAEDRAALGWCFGILGNSLWLEGRVAQAHDIAESLLESAAGQAEPWGEGMCLVLLAGCQLEAGEIDRARATVRAALRAFAELDDPWGEASARLVHGMAERVAGDLPAAIAALERGLGTARQVDSVGGETRLRAELAAALLDAGDPEGAEREARATLHLVRSGSGDADSEIRALVVLSKRASSLGDDRSAGALIDEAIDLADGAVRTSIWRRAAALAAILAANAGDVARAEDLAAAAVQGSWESARTWTLAQRATAAVQRARGNQAGARATLQAVLDRFRDRPLAFVDGVRDDLRGLGS
jgi:class 3 adenylate cyclase/tetratricopeptide (TPR) repeat protein